MTKLKFGDVVSIELATIKGKAAKRLADGHCPNCNRHLVKQVRSRDCNYCQCRCGIEISIRDDDAYFMTDKQLYTTLDVFDQERLGRYLKGDIDETLPHRGKQHAH